MTDEFIRQYIEEKYSIWIGQEMAAGEEPLRIHLRNEIKKINKIRDRIDWIMHQIMLEMRNVLTPSQYDSIGYSRLTWLVADELVKDAEKRNKN